MGELKACPFCHGEAELLFSLRAVRCTKCQAAVVSPGSAPRSEILEKWNRRTDPPVLECQRCGCKSVRVYELDGLPVVECSDCCASWGLWS